MVVQYTDRQREHRPGWSSGGNRFCRFLHCRQNHLNGTQPRIVQSRAGSYHSTRALWRLFLQLQPLPESAPLRPSDGSLCMDSISWAPLIWIGLGLAGLWLSKVAGSRTFNAHILSRPHLAACLLCCQFWAKCFLKPVDLQPDLFSLETQSLLARWADL